MIEKFLEKVYYYDFLAVVLPGLIFISFVLSISFPFSFIQKVTGLQATILVISGTFFFGLILQAVSSWLQKPLHFLWGGMPSRKILSTPNSFVSDARRALLAKSLTEKFNLKLPTSDQPFVDEELSHTLVRRCQALCLNKNVGRGEEFNAKYAMTRNLFGCCFVFGLCWIVSFILLKLGLVTLSNPGDWVGFYTIGIITLVGIVTFFFRAKDRGYYWCREVLEQGEELIRQESSS